MVDVLRWKWGVMNSPIYKEPTPKVYHRKCGGVAEEVKEGKKAWECDRCNQVVDPKGPDVT